MLEELDELNQVQNIPVGMHPQDAKRILPRESKTRHLIQVIPFACMHDLPMERSSLQGVHITAAAHPVRLAQ